MSRHSLKAALAAAAIFTLIAAGCGDDDDDAASSDTETDQADQSDSTTGSGDVDAYCEASLALEVAPGPDVDFESASEEEIATAVQAWASDTMQPLVADALEVVPDEIATDAQTASDAIDQVAEGGDPSALESPEVDGALDRIHQFDLDNCGWSQQAVEASEYQFEGIPESLSAGPTSFEFSNVGNELHELLLVRKNDGVTQSAEELLALPEDQAQQMVTMIGDPAFAAPGESDYKVVDLEPGEYVVVCFIPTGTTSEEAQPAPDAPPHAMQGMFAEFTVS